MLLLLTAVLGLTQLGSGAEDLSVKALTQKALERRLAQMSFAPSKLPQIILKESPPRMRACAIPLKEAKAPVGKHFDRMTMPIRTDGINRMTQPMPLPVCQQR